MRRRWRRRAGETPASWLTWAARFGYAACGVVYAAVGLIAVGVALGLADEPADSEGVLIALARLPFGPLVLVALGIGLIGYALLNVAGAIADPEQRGVSYRAIVERAVDILTGAIYIALAVAAIAIVVDPARDATGTLVSSATAVLALPYGNWILALIGVALVASGGYLFYRAFAEPFGEMLDRRSLSGASRTAIAYAARAGTAARGLIFAVCGVFAFRAASDATADSVAGVGDALNAIGTTPFGPLLLGVVGSGFIAYGGYQLAKARYQRIAPPASARES